MAGATTPVVVLRFNEDLSERGPNATVNRSRERTPRALAGFSHEEFWIESGVGKPVPGKVAIRGVMPAGGDELTGHSEWTLVLVSATEGARTGSIGQTYCIAVNVDDAGDGNVRYGLRDAGTYAECLGGWKI